jgi:pimeloyl-ACP methyl ester carboxylesterase
MRRVPGLIVAVWLALGLAGAAAAAPPAYDMTLAPYASSKDSVRLPDGRTIHMVCMGKGSPVVVLTAGAGGWGIVWNRVQAQVAKKTRVCTWDRAGFGMSSISPKPQTVDNTTSDLQAALKAGHIEGPYVAVGHSLGGFESLLLKDRQPGNVVGMVLVDPSTPGQAERFRKIAPALFVSSLQDPVASLFHRCAEELRSGEVRAGGPDPDGCLRPLPPPPEYPPELRAALDKHPNQLPPETVAAAMDFLAAANSPLLLDQDSRITVKPGRNYGRMPLIVLTAGDMPPGPNMSAAVKAETPLIQAESRRLHDELAALSTRGSNRVVPGTTHFIQQIKPQVVIDAIDEVVDEARADMAKSRRIAGR